MTNVRSATTTLSPPLLKLFADTIRGTIHDGGLNSIYEASNNRGLLLALKVHKRSRSQDISYHRERMVSRWMISKGVDNRFVYTSTGALFR